MYTRKRVDFRLPPDILKAAKDLCKYQSMGFTYYIESLIRIDLKKRNLFPQPEPVNHGTFEEWGWEEKSKLKKVI